VLDVSSFGVVAAVASGEASLMAVSILIPFVGAEHVRG